MNFIAKMELQYCGVSQCTFLYLGTGTGSSARAAASQQPAAQQQQQPAAAGARPACPADAACGEW
jgi:hypothetical protein